MWLILGDAAVAVDGQRDDNGKNAQDPGDGLEEQAAAGAAEGQGAGGVHRMECKTTWAD